MTMTKHDEALDVRNRWTGAVQFTATITCAPDAMPAIKLGLALQWGFDNRAILDGAILDGAILDGARLDRASLVGASLDGAILDGARLVGASLVGASLVGASLDGASLDGAILDGAILDGAILDRASLDRASLVGALFGKQKVVRLIARAVRLSDSNEAFAFEMDDGAVWIKGGCKWLSLVDFEARAKAYDDKGKRDETLDLLAYIEKRAKRMGMKL